MIADIARLAGLFGPTNDRTELLLGPAGILHSTLVYVGLNRLAHSSDGQDSNHATRNFWWLKIWLCIKLVLTPVRMIPVSLKTDVQGYGRKILAKISEVYTRADLLIGEGKYQLQAHAWRWLRRDYPAVDDLHKKQITTSTPLYKYEELDDGHIRLIKLKAERYGRLPLIQIIHAPLDSAPPFITCSYTWGSTMLDCFVEVVSQTGDVSHVRITDSAWNILSRSGWMAVTDQMLWIDAICIDQTNTREKEIQVAMMRSIYQKAALVSVYLDTSFQPFHHHYLLSEIVRSVQDRKVTQSKLIRLADMSPWKNCWFEIDDLFCCPWYTRAWVVQEAAAARKLKFVYRTLEMDGNMYRNLCLALLFIESNALFGRSVVRQSSLPLKNTGTLRMGDGIMNMTRLLVLNKALNRGQVMKLEECLRLGETYLSTDTRDKVYAFLGLTSDENRRNLPVDYNMSAPELLTRAMREVLRQSQDIDELAAVDNTQYTVSTPTWVSRWQSIYDTPRRYVWNLYSAATSQPWPGIGDSSFYEIDVPTCMFDTVKLLQSDPGDFWTPSVQTAGLKRRTVGSLVDVMKSRWDLPATSSLARGRYESEEAIRMAFWRTILSDVLAPREADTVRLKGDSKDMQAFNVLHWIYGLEPNERPVPALADTMDWTGAPPGAQANFMRAYYDSAHRNLSNWNQRLGVTSSGRLGLFPRSTQTGDTVALFASAHLPFTIRKADEAQQDGVRYKLVGYCYVHGVMDGEAATGPWSNITLV